MGCCLVSFDGFFFNDVKSKPKWYFRLSGEKAGKYIAHSLCGFLCTSDVRPWHMSQTRNKTKESRIDLDLMLWHLRVDSLETWLNLWFEGWKKVFNSFSFIVLSTVHSEELRSIFKPFHLQVCIKKQEARAFYIKISIKSTEGTWSELLNKHN